MFSKFIDSYDIKARFFPALLAMLGPILSFIYFFQLNESTAKVATSGVVVSALIVFFCQLSRSWGKKLEKNLLKEWGSFPTTKLLLYSETNLPPVSLERYRETLERLVPQLVFVNKEDEITHLDKAKDACASAVAWLRNNTRDAKKYHLIFTENVNYGFRRNFRGLKWIALLIHLAALAVIGGSIFLEQGFAYAAYPMSFWISCLINIVCCVLLVCCVTKDFVTQAAYTYAYALLSACDTFRVERDC